MWYLPTLFLRGVHHGSFYTRRMEGPIGDLAGVDYWQIELDEARRRYAEGPTEESRIAYRTALKTFTEAVMTGRAPKRPKS